MDRLRQLLVTITEQSILTVAQLNVSNAHITMQAVIQLNATTRCNRGVPLLALLAVRA